MSIKLYLFALFGGLILLLGLSQLMIGEMLKRQLDTELEQHSLALSRQLVDIAVEDLGEDIHLIKLQQPETALGTAVATKDGKHAISRGIVSLQRKNEAGVLELQHREIEQDIADINAVMAQHGQSEVAADRTLKWHNHEPDNLAKIPQSLPRRYQQALYQSLSALEIKRSDSQSSGKLTIARKLADGRIERRNIEFSPINASDGLTRFREWMFALILVSSLLGLVFVYWLSRRVSAPLSELAEGHRKLGEGALGYQVLPRGVTEIRQMLEGFNAMSDKLAQLSAREQQLASQQHLAELGEITRGIAHSLRNPLHTLGLLADSHNQAKDTDAKASLLADMQQKIVMMDKRIQTLLTLSSSAVDRSGLVPITSVVQDILLELSVTGVCLTLSLYGFDQPHRLKGMESEIRAVLHAVIINAVEAQQASPSPVITIGISSEQGWLKVTVTDQGPGIENSLISSLGQPHVTTKPEGTGMGLYIASRILASHYGGRLEFGTAADGGTEVKVYFARTED